MFILISFHFTIYIILFIINSYLHAACWLVYKQTNKQQQNKISKTKFNNTKLSIFIYKIYSECLHFFRRNKNKCLQFVFFTADQPRNQVHLNRPQYQFPQMQHQPVQKNFSSSFVEFLNSSTTLDPRNIKIPIQQGTDTPKAIPNFVTAADASRLQ